MRELGPDFETDRTIGEEDTARIAQSVRELGDKLSRTALGHDLTSWKLADVEDLVRTHVMKARLAGIPLPDLVVVVMQSRANGSCLRVVRRDLDYESVQNLIVDLALQYPSATAKDIADAIHRALPHYRSTVLNLEAARKRREAATAKRAAH